MNLKDYQGIWVIAEQMGGCLNSVSFELLGKAQELKKQLQTPEPVVAVVLGKDIAEMAKELGAYGAEEIIVVDHPGLELYQNQTYAEVLADLIQTRKPSILLMGATGIGQDLAPVLGVKVNTGVAAHCVDLRINEDNNLVAVVPAFGGKVLGDILCPKHRPQMATLKPGVLGKPVRNNQAHYTITKYDPAESLKKDAGRVKALGIYRQEVKGVPLEEAEIVVAGGWGMGSQENWQLLEELASLLGGAVGCTRPPVDEKWVEGEHQMIGTSGKTVRPKVYIGAAISGATHHVCGMKDSGLIISINKDPKAPIFEVSDIRIVGDAKTILSKLIEEIKKIRGNVN
ncbi:MAG: electron transfer flavoprotein subunit alpha/FixB family protein [Bacillota bacterium]